MNELFISAVAFFPFVICLDNFHLPVYIVACIFLCSLTRWFWPQAFNEEEAGAGHLPGGRSVRLLWSCFHQCQASESSVSLSNSSYVTPYYRLVMTCLSPSGFLSGLVQEARCGAAKARPCYVPKSQSSWGCSEGSVWRREIWDQCFPKSGATEIWTTNEGSFSQLAGTRQVWIVDLIPGVIYVNI